MVLLLLVLVTGVSSQNQGPVFVQEPPAGLTFSNTTGSQVSCSAYGSPEPQVDWLLQDGEIVTAVPGLRQSLGNGTLYFPPFRAEDYRKDVHYTVYRCRASNSAGTIISRDVNVRAVVNQHYEVQVYHTHVLKGNNAVLTCVIPSFVKEYVTVTSWSRDDNILLPGANNGGRFIVTYGTGELHIKSAQTEDGLFQYSCLTLHILTQERKRSAPAILTVTESSGSIPPRFAPSVETAVSAERESGVHLTCSAQGNPPPTFSWFREERDNLQPVRLSPHIEILEDILHIRRLEPDDAGRWTCKASNSFGEQRLDIQLTVTAHLNVHVMPQLQVINSGGSAMFNCTVSGSPVSQFRWLRNGEWIHPDSAGKIKLLSPQILSVTSITRHDKGMYQCLVYNERESAQGGAELRLGDTIPELQYTFIEQAVRPGPHVSLRCSGTGSPPPQFRWFLYGEPLADVNTGRRYTISQYVDRTGDVISHLNISNVRVEDGGLYSCRAVNSLGSTEHSARLNIYGPPFIRSIGPVKAVAGSDITLHCPYSGYPIESVRWERHRQELPLDLRHRLGNDGSLTISKLNPSVDAGFYTCFVTSRDGQFAKREIQLVINSPPVLEPFAFPANLQEGSRAQVSCYVTSGDMPIHFMWYKDNDHISANLQVEERAAEFYSILVFKEISSKHSGNYTCVEERAAEFYSILVFKEISSKHSGNYTCVASNSAAEANYTAQLMVKVAPQWLLEPQDKSVLLGDQISLECLATGFPEPQLVWLKGEGKTSTNYQPLLSVRSHAMIYPNGTMWIETASPQDEGYYLCKATNGIGPGLTKVVFVSINEPVRFDFPMKNISVKRGNPAKLICRIYGDIPIEVKWRLSNLNLNLNNYRFSITNTNTENGITSQLLINNTDRDDSGAYRCIAKNAYGQNDHTINLLVQERPDPPRNLTVIEVSSRSVRLAWTRPFDGNSPLIGYLVQYQALGANLDWRKSATVNVTLSTKTDTATGNLSEFAVIRSLFPSTVYTFRMLAVNSIDQSSFTEPAVVKTQQEEPSEPPRDVKIENVGPGELSVAWAAPPKDSWNGELLGYIVTWNEQDAYANQTKSATVKGWATTRHQITGLKKFTRYKINIRAFNSVSTGPASPTVIGTTKEGVPEAPPQNIICSQISSQSMKVSWLAPPQHQHGGFIQGYKVYYRPVSSENVHIPTVAEVKRTSSIETYLHGLYKFTNYSIQVLAYTGAGDGVISNPLYCVTEEDLPGPPAGIKAAALTGESILISWLPPTKPNGRISHYTVYGREAGRVEKHTSYSVRTGNTPEEHGLTYEMRNLAEHQLYEFWVSASTGIGEGEPTPIVTQTTNSRAPSRIASFGQHLRKSVKSKILLPCLAVGNPTPRTRWIYRDKPITFSSFYEITNEGHLRIHSADQSLEGNYTCSAKNLFGNDNITYMLTVLMPPGAPSLVVQYTTATSLRLQWSQPDDGGAMIQGYTLNVKHDTNDWKSIELSSEHTAYTLDNLRCGSMYHVYLYAYNSVGSGSPSPIRTVRTKGGAPLLPKEKDFISTNATAIQLNLYNWPDGGCEIYQFSIQYRAMGKREWNLVSNSISEDKITLQGINASTWYQIKVMAENDAGRTTGLFNAASTSPSGEAITSPPNLSNGVMSSQGINFKEAYIIAPSIIGAILVFVVSLLWFVIIKRKRNMESEDPADDTEPSTEKTAEEENAKNCQQIYTSSPVKVPNKIEENSHGMYEISPYATFNVSGKNTHTATTSALDYTMHFKTFGHIEDDDRNTMYPKKSNKKKHAWNKHRFYSNDVRDSESDETSGSPCGDFPSGSNYRVPTKPPRDLFRPDSSTESNDISPLTERRNTPRHVGAPRYHQRPSSCSSSEEKSAFENTSPEENMELLPPHGFSDAKELSDTECDRDMMSTSFYKDLATLVERYQRRKKQEEQAFVIHV